MTIVTVDLAGRPYDIHVEDGLLGRADKLIAPLLRGRRALVITDSHVERHIWPQLQDALSAASIDSALFTMPAGEASKSWHQLAAITDWLLDNHVERSDHIMALGGGVVGDITGFAAHIVKRGCNFIQIPTTLLAQVDSSVGGKTAINSAAGKNLVGAFHQPSLVVIDPTVLATLPRRDLGAGYAEVVKYGMIDDAAFFEWCENSLDAFFGGDAVVRESAIVRSVKSKARIVAADERETTGTRALLNLGHTFGHALEAQTGFSERLLHGEAVAAGCALAFRYSNRLGLCPAADADRVAALLKRAQLPTTLREAGAVASSEILISHMLHDKKMARGTLPFLLARGIGQTFLSADVDLSDVAAFLDEEAAR